MTGSSKLQDMPVTKLSDTASISAVIAYARALIAWPRATQSSGQSIPSASFSRVRTNFPSSSKCPMHNVQSSESLCNQFSHLPLSAKIPYQMTRDCVPCNCTTCQPIPSCCAQNHPWEKTTCKELTSGLINLPTISKTWKPAKLSPCTATQRWHM